MQRKTPRRPTLLLALLTTPTPALALTADWLPTAPSPAPFSDPTNWSTNTTPTPSDTARFDTHTTHTVTLPTDTTTDQLLLATDDLTLDLAGHTYTLANSSALGLSLGSPATSSLTLLNSTPTTPATLSAIHFTMSPNPGDSSSLTLNNDTTLVATTLYAGGTYNTPGGTATVDIRSGSLNLSTLKIWNTPGTSVNLAGGSLKLGHLETGSDPSRFHWTGGTLELTNSAFEVSNPTTLSPVLTYIFNPGPSLSLTPGMSLNISGQSNSSNSLVVDNGGTLSADNASISVNAAAYIGYASTGTLTLSNHASLSAATAINIGDYYASPGTHLFGNGTVSLDHDSSLSTPANLYIGSNGTGTLVIQSGSSVSAANAFVSYGPLASSVTIDGTNSSLTTTGSLSVGDTAQGSLTVSNAASVSSAAATVGYSNLPGTSSATLQGPGTSWTNTGTLYIARAPYSTSSTTASLALSDHASLSTRTLAIATTSPNTAGSLSLSSHSTLSISYSAYLGGALTPGGSASLSLTDSSATIASTLKLHPTPNTSLALTRSTLTIGTPASPGSLDNAASITLADHSTLTLHGPLATPGTLTLSPTSLFLWDPSTSTPTPLDDLRSLLATSHLLPSPTSPPNTRLAYTTTFSGEPTAPTSLLVSLALTGDANLDGQITPDDYALLDRAYARALSSAHWTDGDFNYDGSITPDDYLLLDSAYAQTHSLSPDFLSQRESQFGPAYVSTLLTSVPEPSSLALLFLTLPLTRRALPRRRRPRA